MPTIPILIRNHLQPSHGATQLLILHEERVYVPEPALLKLIGAFSDDGKGGFIAAGQAVGGGYGYLDGRGVWLRAPTLQEAFGFSGDGLARFRDGDTWGYFGLDGKIAIAPRYEKAGAFVQGLAAVQIDMRWRYIDRSGRFAFDGDFFAAQAFSEVGLAVASPALSAGFGYIDRQGTWAIAPQFAQTPGFTRHGVAPASLDGDQYGLIDASGSWILKPTGWRISKFNDAGYAHYYRLSGAWDGEGYLDTSGREVIEGQRQLSKHMQAGWAKQGENVFLSANGELSTSEHINWSCHFNEHDFAAARSLQARRNDAGEIVHEGVWGVLQADGRFHAAPAGVLEPLTDTDGAIFRPEPGTPLAAFCTQDQNVALLAADASIAYRLEREAAEGSETIALRDAAGRLLWRGEPSDAVGRAQPFFRMGAGPFLDGLDDCAQLPGMVDAMLAEMEQKLHALAAGERAAAEQEDEDEDEYEDEDEDDDEDEDEEEYEDEDEDRDSAELLSTSRRVFRAYIDEYTWGTYQFLSDERGDLSEEVERDMAARLIAAFGPADPDPDFAGAGAGRDIRAWSFALRQPLSGCEQMRAESRQLWIGMTSNSDSGDGDVWYEIWLHCAPSVETLEAAMLAASAAEPDDEESGEFDEPDAAPSSYEDWLEQVCDSHHAIAEVPPGLFDDAMADAAVEADLEAYRSLPSAFQTPARLEALIRAGAVRAAHIPSVCMTAEGLVLARSLYAEVAEWNRTDKQKSNIPAPPLDSDSLGQVWGCLIDAALAFDAVRAGVALDDVPRWLRSEALEEAALQADILNIRYLDSDRITPELAERAVRERHSGLLEYLPMALRTAALCLASVNTNGASLEFVPDDFKTVALCAAAMRNDSEAAAFIPPALEEAVYTHLIDEDNAGQNGTLWHGLRAWTRLWRKDHAGAIADATLAIDKVPFPAHAHYILARAYHATGLASQAAQQAATVLSIWDTYETEFGGYDHTQWLKWLAASEARTADEEILLKELASKKVTLSQIPQSRISAQMVAIALKANRAAVQFVPKRLMTSELYALAIERGVKDGCQVPAPMWTEALALTAVRYSKYNLKCVPVELRTPAVMATQS